jgi:hypothetical protein
MKLIHHTDCGHGWLEVPVELYLIAPSTLSSFSYYDKETRTLYLEEDFDAEAFYESMKEGGKEITWGHKEHAGECFIRDLDRVSDHLIFRLKQLAIRA